MDTSFVGPFSFSIDQVSSETDIYLTQVDEYPLDSLILGSKADSYPFTVHSTPYTRCLSES